MTPLSRTESLATGTTARATEGVLAPSTPAAVPLWLAWWQHWAVFGASFLLVALFTYPLILEPGSLLPLHKDPFMYGWTMVSNTQRLLSAPLAVFHGNTFYPHGNTIAYTDLLLTPTLTAGPIYLLTGNPVLQYNLTLLIWWALSGWAMYVAALALLQSHPGAAIAALVFTLCPYRTDFHREFQMQLAFPIPLGVLCALRFLETRRWRFLLLVTLLLWVEALASMYYAIILGLCLVVVAGVHALLRSGAWSWRMVGQGLVGAALLGAVLAPFLIPYVQNRRELGFERALRQPAKHSADILTYFETGVTKLYRFKPSNHIAETSLFMGFVALGLAAVACVVREPASRREREPYRRHTRRALTLSILGAVLMLILMLVWGDALRPVGLRPSPQRFFDIILLLAVARLAFEGAWAARAGEHRGPLGERELRWLCLFLIAIFFVLSLGPHIHFARRELGTGLYYYLHQLLPPLKAMRITSRIGVVVVLGVSLLAGLGMKKLAERLPGFRPRAIVAGLVGALLLAEYAPFPLPYQRIDWRQPPAVYAALAADPDDVAVLQWPLGNEYWDDYYTFMSIGHGKRLINGASGFLPWMTRDISSQLSRPDRPKEPFPSPGVVRYLLGIHPLRYLVVHNAQLGPDEHRKWQRLREMPWATRLGTFDGADLYRLSGAATGVQVDKLFSWDYARTRHEVSFEVHPIGPPAEQRWVEVDLNGRPLGRQRIGREPSPVVMPLTGPRTHSAPNRVTIRWRYRTDEDPSERAIGRTGVVSPVDLYVASAGFDVGNRASIFVNGLEVARDRRGYQLAAIDAGTGQVLWSERFDTFASPQESQRLAETVGRLAAGTIVAAAVRDEASGALTGDGVAALRSLGASEDIRGRFRTSHLLVGVKGASPGTAIERSGYAFLEVTLGTPHDRIGMEIRSFTLR